MTDSGKQRPQGNWLLVLAVVALSALPVLVVRGEFSSADGQGMDAISEIQPSYRPWFNAVVALPSGEVESLLFSSQAALGAGVIGYVIGLYKGRALNRGDESPD
jgi:cobalt/nickel transport protein